MANLSGNILIITNGEISTAVVDAATARVQGTTQIVDGKDLKSYANDTADGIISIANVSGAHSQDQLFELIRILKPGGSLVVNEPLAGRTSQHSMQLSSSLTLAGFTNISINSTGEFTEFVALKPNWTFGTTQSISIKKKPETDPSIWQVEEDNMVDEKDLVGEEDFSKPVQSDCEVSGTRKACKNCTCGRAEMEAGAVKKQKLTLEMLENPGVNSSCGNCALGDAFRCAGCPYRGLPAFKPGEKITLPPDFVLDDIIE